MERVGSLPPCPRPLPARDAAPGAVGGDARAQRGGLPRPVAEGLVERAPRPRPGRSRCSWSRTARRDSTLADADALRGRRPTRSSCSPARWPTTARRCAPGSSPPRATSSSSSTSTTTTPTSSTTCSRRLARAGRPRDRRRVEAGAGHPRHRARGPRRAITAGFADVLRFGFGLRVSDTHGMKAMRRDDGRADRPALPQRHRPLRHRARAARRARRALAWPRCRSSVEERRPSRSPISRRVPRTMLGLVRLRVQLWRRAVGPPDRPLPRPLRRRALAAPGRRARGRRGRGRDARASSTATSPTSSCCFASPHFVGALDDLAFALAQPARPRVMLGATAVAVVGGPTRSRTGPRCRRVRRVVCPTPTLTPVALDLEAHARRRRDHRLARARPRPATLLLLADPFTFPIDGFLAPAATTTGPDLQVIGGVASAARGPGRQPPRRSTAQRRDDRARSACSSTGCRRAHRRVAGLPPGRPAATSSPGARATGSRSSAAVPALDRLQDAASEASEEDRALLRAGLHLGFVVDEHQRRLRPRRLPRAQRARRRPRRPARSPSATTSRSGRPCSSTSATPAAADEDLRELLAGRRTPRPRWCSRATGAAARLFGEPDHDAGVVDRAARAAAGRGRVLRRRDRPGRRPQLPPRLHRQRSPCSDRTSTRVRAVGSRAGAVAARPRRARRRGAMATTDIDDATSSSAAST